ncbi:MAG: efflux RND transporter periplasmic adaptor subunit [Deltaproteobacteria bacterium]|jgi:RND family efflux transporter MFP subunit|nr:efflux RND transporter periplasmic adaptor subunit [Deltaproteobacteria bacterium]
MLTYDIKAFIYRYFLIAAVVCLLAAPFSMAKDPGRGNGPPPSPVQVALVKIKTVSNQISLVGTTEPISESTVASEISGLVENFPIREGDYVKKGNLLANLKETELKLRLKGVVAAKKRIEANLENAEKELKRLSKLKETNSIAEKQYDTAFYTYRALSQELLQNESEIELLNYEMKQQKVLAPFSGFVAKEHTQIGEWINKGGPVVTLLDLDNIRITVDVPERYSVLLVPESNLNVSIKSVSNHPFSGKIYSVLPQGDPNSRTFPVRIHLANPDHKIKSGMEAMVTFNLSTEIKALLVPKDAVVTAGDNRLVFTVNDGKAISVPVKIIGYYDGDVAVEGDLKPGDQVVIRGNERLRPGQPVVVQK